MVNVDGREATLWLDGKEPELWTGDSVGEWKKIYPSRREIVSVPYDRWSSSSATLIKVLESRGLGSRPEMVESIPFDLSFEGWSDLRDTFSGFSSLREAPQIYLGEATRLDRFFQGCGELTFVPDIDTSGATEFSRTFTRCYKLTDGNVRFIGKNPGARTIQMRYLSPLTRDPFYDENGNPI